MSLSPDTLLQGGKYRIVRFISAGGFGCTYEAVHTSLNGRIAIKEFFVSDICNRDEATGYVSVGLQSKAATFDKLREKFIREAQAVFSLSHPGIVHVSDVFEENGTAYFVMDYIDGISLDDLVSQYGPMSEETALDFIRQVCDALAYVHSNNRLHLDIKPGNIMVDQNGRAILIDFGASKQYDTGRGENLSTLLGFTPGFAPPEQMTADVSRFLPATDIYAVAATLYNLLTGAAPLSANQRSAGDENEPLPTSVSESTRRAINAALQLNKSVRPQTVAEFSAMLFGETAASQTPTPKPVASLSRDTECIKSHPAERKPAPTPSPSSNKTKKIGEKSATKSRTPLYVTIVAIVAILTFGVIYLLPKDGETFPASNVTNDAEPIAPKGHEACNHLDLYTTYQGKARFFTVDEWNAVPESERGAYSKKGVVVKCNGVPAFSLALHDSGSEEMTWDEAVRRYGESALPSEAQCRAMASDYQAINKAIIAFGGDKDPELWYWGKSYDASSAWDVNMYNGYVYNYGSKTNTLRVRAVASVVESAK